MRPILNYFAIIKTKSYGMLYLYYLVWLKRILYLASLQSQILIILTSAKSCYYSSNIWLNVQLLKIFILQLWIKFALLPMILLLYHSLQICSNQTIKSLCKKYRWIYHLIIKYITNIILANEKYIDLIFFSLDCQT